MFTNRYKFKGSGRHRSHCRITFMHFYCMFFLIYGLVWVVENSGGEQIDTLNLGGQLVSSRDRKPPPVAMLM